MEMSQKSNSHRILWSLRSSLRVSVPQDDPAQQLLIQTDDKKSTSDNRKLLEALLSKDALPLDAKSIDQGRNFAVDVLAYITNQLLNPIALLCAHAVNRSADSLSFHEYAALVIMHLKESTALEDLFNQLEARDLHSKLKPGGSLRDPRESSQRRNSNYKQTWISRFMRGLNPEKEKLPTVELKSTEASPSASNEDRERNFTSFEKDLLKVQNMETKSSNSESPSNSAILLSPRSDKSSPQERIEVTPKTPVGRLRHLVDTKGMDAGRAQISRAIGAQQSQSWNPGPSALLRSSFSFNKKGDSAKVIQQQIDMSKNDSKEDSGRSGSLKSLGSSHASEGALSKPDGRLMPEISFIDPSIHNRISKHRRSNTDVDSSGLTDIHPILQTTSADLTKHALYNNQKFTSSRDSLMFTSIFGDWPDGILLVENEKVLHANHEALKIIGDLHIVGKDIMDIQNMSNIVKKYFQKAIRDEKSIRLQFHTSLDKKKVYNCYGFPFIFSEDLISSIPGTLTLSTELLDITDLSADPNASHSGTGKRYILSFRDVSEAHIKLKNELEDAQNAALLFKVIVEFSNEMICLLEADSEATIKFITNSCETILSTPANELVNVSFLRFFRKSDEGIVGSTWSEFLNSPNMSSTSVVSKLTPDVWIETHFVKLDWLGMVIATSRNISDRKLQETESRKRELAEHAANAKSRQLDFLAHKVRNPLNGIIGNLNELSRAVNLDETERELTDCALMCSYELQRAVTDVLSISQNSMNVILEEGWFGAPTLLRTVISQIQALCRMKDISINAELSPELSEIIMYGDSIRIQQILSNFAHNAVKYTDSAGYVTLSVKLLESNEISPGCGLFMFSVLDNGCGISESDIQRLLHGHTDLTAEVVSEGIPLRNSTVFGTVNRGMGLTLCKMIAKSVKGELKISSQVGEGSEFSFIVQLRYASINDLDAPQLVKIGSSEFISTSMNSRRRSRRGSRSLKSIKSDGDLINGKKVMVVDDEIVNVKLMERALLKFGCECTVGYCGEDLLNAIIRDGLQFDIILLDQVMPGIKGHEVVEKIREWEKKEKKSRSIIIMVTANASSSFRELYDSSGADGLIEKPVNLRELPALIAKIIDTL